MSIDKEWKGLLERENILHEKDQHNVPPRVHKRLKKLRRALKRKEKRLAFKTEFINKT